MHNRFTEFGLWCDDMMEYFKKELEETKEFEKVCGSSGITQNRIKYYSLKIKLLELRKKHYLETGSDRLNFKDEKIADLIKEASKYDESLGGLVK